MKYNTSKSEMGSNTQTEQNKTFPESCYSCTPQCCCAVVTTEFEGRSAARWSERNKAHAGMVFSLQQLRGSRSSVLCRGLCYFYCCDEMLSKAIGTCVGDMHDTLRVKVASPTPSVEHAHSSTPLCLELKMQRLHFVFKAASKMTM